MSEKVEELCKKCLLQKTCKQMRVAHQQGYCADFVKEGVFKGICITCHRRNICKKSNQEGGVWSCPDFE